jgi:hypothetical protein
MAHGDPIPPDTIIYRALRKKHINQDGSINETAFLLTPAHDEYQDETELSFCFSADVARAVIENVRGVCQLRVADIIALGLRATESEDPQHVDVRGMPCLTVDTETAHRVAKDLRDKATKV